MEEAGGAEGKAPLQHHKSGNKDFGKVLMELKVSLPVAERLDSMALRGPFHPKPFCDSTIPKDQKAAPTTGIHPTAPAGMHLQPLGKAHTVFNFPKDATHPTATARLLPLCSISTGAVLDSGQIVHGIFTGTAAGIENLSCE